MQMPVCTKTFLLKIGATNHPGKGLDPPQTGNAQMNRYKFSLGLPLLLTNQIFCCLVQDKDLAFDALLTCQNGQQPGKLLVDVADKLEI